MDALLWFVSGRPRDVIRVQRGGLAVEEFWRRWWVSLASILELSLHSHLDAVDRVREVLRVAMWQWHLEVCFPDLTEPVEIAKSFELAVRRGWLTSRMEAQLRALLAAFDVADLDSDGPSFAEDVFERVRALMHQQDAAKQ